MKARQRQARIFAAVVVGVLASGSLAQVDAQQQQALRPGQTPGPRFMVPIFRSVGEPRVGLQFSEAARSRLSDDINIRTLWIVPKTDITNTLEASGYSTTEALNSNDTKALANLLRAEEYVEGIVTKTPNGFRVDASLKLVRGEGMEQPLAPIETGKLDDAAKRLKDQIVEARKQIDGAQKCMLSFRQKKYDEARREAQKAIAAYANAVMPRVCLAEILNEQKAAPEEILKVTEEILKAHPQNRRALAFAADAYNATKQEDKYIQALTSLLAADPTNVRLQTTVVNALAASGKAELARPIIEDAVKQNPGDPSLVRLQWLIYLTLKDYKNALAVGEEMVKTDTAAADTSYFIRSVAAAVADSQAARASEIAARGVAKFPNNVGLLQTLAQLQRTQGQMQQAVATLQKIVQIDPKAQGVWPEIARAQGEMNAPADTIIATLEKGKAAGDSATTVGTFALAIGQNLYRKATASKALEDYAEALKVLNYADQNAPRPEAKFLAGVTQLGMGQQLLQKANDEKSCELSREAQNAFNEAQIKLPEGGKFNPQAAGQALQGLQQLAPYAERMVKAYCK